MKILHSIVLLIGLPLLVSAQGLMTPEMLWQLGRVSPVGVSGDKTQVVYGVTQYDAQANTKSTQYFSIPIQGGTASKIENPNNLVADKNLSRDGKYKLSHKAVHIQNVTSQDYYPTLGQSDAYIYDDLMYRHWDSWADGSYNHVIMTDLATGEELDLMKNKLFHSPTMPFGGDEDYIWNPRSHQVLYVTKTKVGTAYATSTNTDIFVYDLNSQTTTNLTKGMMGYDNSPAFSPKGVLAWLSMKRDGYESDKNDIIVEYRGAKYNLTEHWDGTVSSFLWGEKGKNIFFVAPVDGTKQLFVVDFPGSARKMPTVRQLTKGQFDVVNIVGQSGSTLIVGRSDMNHATELYRVNLKNAKFTQLTHVNDEVYASIQMGKVEKRMVTTTDNKQMVTWVIYPPNFDPTKKYPTLLYCQGGPQGALSQFYSYRWNFQLMAAKGYIIVAPNRRGMPGHGVEWNEQISTDYGGQNMQDYLAAIDDVAKESYVDNNRLGAVGASYGGYSVFYLAGMHEGRFKSFIAHDGIFNWRSMYGTTEEMFFMNWDLGGAYWEQDNATAQRSFNEFNPINHVAKWDTPIMIVQGGKDYRVPIGQGLEAFQAAQLRGIKSRLLYLPNENHWVLSAQNALVWQKEFFRWLSETL
ncbi:Dipeptidyl aminopeptidase/acylaminoacyl peptidase [Reichenbachiella agariperforans]|uniref:Dipeptidyl aminopeptidase/acylaminoacyl peptidase n=1 Tax=Reichenbachiella agariperforans TaxID=156994 RepID=A0A1M6LMX0_REIAG|nr:alpha/beta fold hydrolase [Reichenbachiella agariperforans]SHJ72480.1 Dipeptidyl aminopeptidase/acylaminoacyl peptidase [Reichenbachiella agariperforans]